MHDSTPSVVAIAVNGSDHATVHVIQSTFHYRDDDGRPAEETTVVVEEGWFEDIESAGLRRDQLNAQNRRLYDVDMARARRERDAKIADAKQRNAELAVLIENGFSKQLLDVPSEFSPVPFESYRPDRSFSTYEVVELQRSELDGIANAARQVEVHH